MNPKTPSTVLTEAAKSALVPKLRFPEFWDKPSWEDHKLGDAALFYNGRAYKQEELLEQGKYKVLRVGNFFTNNSWYYSDLELEEAKYCNKGDLLYAWSASFGPRIWMGEKTIYHYHIWKVEERDGIDKAFLFITLEHQTERMKAQSANGLGLLHITKGTIESWDACFPRKPEQQKIAECMSSVDELIAAQARKVDAIKTHKKGLMQQLFPREGETQPRLRFPEFQNAGEWQEIELGEKVELLSGYPFDGPDISQDSSGIRLLRGINVTEGRIRHNPEIDRYFTGSTEGLEKFRLQVNDLVIGMDGSKVGKNSALVSEADAGALLIQRVARLRTKKASLIQFIFQRIHSTAFHSYVDRINTSSGIPHISAKQIKEFRICFPSDEEQERIASCLTSLDALITAETQKLAALKTHKKGLMQQLFPVAEAE